MVSKASLETLARTMSIAFLCLAVVAVGEEQLSQANAVQPTAKVVVPVSDAKLNILPLEGKKNPVRKTKSSRTKAPADAEARGVWLKALLKEAGFEGYALKQAWAIVMKESRGNPRAHNDNTSTGDNSYGLFQINMLGNLGPERRAKFGISSNTDLFNPLTNAKAAHYMSNGGENWKSWDIDKSGYNGGVSKNAYQYWLTQYPKG